MAIAIGLAAAALNTFQLYYRHGGHTDFGEIWYGARALLHDANPYVLVGPGKAFEHIWPLIYPATAMTLAIPLAVLTEHWAAAVFVGVSAGLLSLAVTKDGWFRLPLFLSPSYAQAVLAAQWSPLMTAALATPVLSWIVVAKPTYVLPLVASVRSKRTMLIAAAGGTALTACAFAIRPTWVGEWFQAVRASAHTTMPILHPGGFFVLLALLKWRRADARLLVGMAAMPQTFYWYETLPLFLIPQTYRQSGVLALVSGAGFLLERWLYVHGNWPMTGRIVGEIQVATMYLPSLMLVLARPNAGGMNLLAVKPRLEGDARRGLVN